jgi:transposase-like protein
MAGKVVPMETRLALMVAGELEAVSVGAVCRELGISRQTYYRLRRRYRQDGPAGLTPRSRRPRHSPQQLDGDRR